MVTACRRGAGMRGNYLTGTYTEDRADTTPTTCWTETGTDYADSYTQNGSHNDYVSVTETGDLFAQSYTVTGGGYTNPSASETFSDGVASGTSNSAGDPIFITVSKTANWGTGVYTSDPSVVANDGTSSVTI